MQYIYVFTLLKQIQKKILMALKCKEVDKSQSLVHDFPSLLSFLVHAWLPFLFIFNTREIGQKNGPLIHYILVYFS